MGHNEKIRTALFSPCPKCGRRLPPIPGCTAGLISGVAESLAKRDVDGAVRLLMSETDWDRILALGYLVCPHNVPASPAICRTLREANLKGESEDPEIERIFAHWVALDREMFTAGPGESLLDRPTPTPWESADARIRSAWEALTAPGNLRGLEKWARMEIMNPRARELSAMALESCRARVGL